MLSQSDITKTAPWERCVIRTRIYYAEKGCRESLTRNHNQALYYANQNWHRECQGEVTANHQANPLRQYYDVGMRITGSKDALGFRFNNVAEMQAAATGLEERTEPMALLCALRLRLACTGWEKGKVAEYLGLGRRLLRRLDKHMRRVCEMHEPRNRFYQVPLTRKRKPRAGWAREILKRYFKLRSELKAAKSGA